MYHGPNPHKTVLTKSLSSLEAMAHKKAKEMIYARIEFNRNLVDYFLAASTKEATRFFIHHFIPKQYHLKYMIIHQARISDGSINKMFAEQCCLDQQMFESLLNMSNNNITALLYLSKFFFKKEKGSISLLDDEADVLENIMQTIMPFIDQGLYVFLEENVKERSENSYDICFDSDPIIQECYRFIRIASGSIKYFKESQNPVFKNYLADCKNFEELISCDDRQQSFSYFVELYYYKKSFEYYATLNPSTICSGVENSPGKIFDLVNDQNAQNGEQAKGGGSKKRKSKKRRQKEKELKEKEWQEKTQPECQQLDQEQEKEEKTVFVENQVFKGEYTPPLILSKRKLQKQQELAHKRALKNVQNSNVSVEAKSNFNEERLQYYRKKLERYQDLICNIFRKNVHLEISWREIENMLKAIEAKIKPASGSRVTLVFQENTINEKWATILGPVNISQRGIHKSHKPGKTDDSIAGIYIKIIQTALTRFGLIPQLLWPEIDLEVKLSNMRLS